jgi:hypothetical protein
MKAYWGSRVIVPHTFLTSALDGSDWSALRPDRLNPRKEPLVPII